MTRVDPLLLIDEAFQAIRDRRYDAARELLGRATAAPDAEPELVRGRLAQCRGTLHYHEGQDDDAIRELSTAFRLLREPAPEKAARVLDMLGMVYSTRNNVHAAREMHLMAMELSQSCGDLGGVATSHGQLGRLALAWGQLEQAERHFRADLDFAARVGDRRAVAQTNNHLGQICMARREWRAAAKFVDLAIGQSVDGGWRIVEMFARKDRAEIHLECGEPVKAQAQLDRAGALAAEFPEGAAHVAVIAGRLAAQRRDWDRGEQQFAAAIDAFSRIGEQAELARAKYHLARLRIARDAPDAVQTLLEALAVAESTRRDAIVREIEEELQRVAPEERLNRELQRARGEGSPDAPVSLHAGVHEAASVIFLDVAGSTDFARVTDPEELMMTLNQLMAEIDARLARHGAAVTVYLGDGLMALVRGRNHAHRAVDAVLDVSNAVADFNAPRELLGLRPLSVRTGVSTGEVFIGYVGTYRKMDFTAIGAAVNLAARLQTEAGPGVPAISSATHEQVSDDFEFSPHSPRMATLKGLGIREVWDVTARRPGRAPRRY